MDAERKEKALPVADEKKETGKRRPGRRAAKSAGNTSGVRYFIGSPSKGEATPALGQEAASEAEALVVAFKKDAHVFLVSEYRVTQDLARGRVTLNKQPVSGSQRVSTVNES